MLSQAAFFLTKTSIKFIQGQSLIVNIAVYDRTHIPHHTAIRDR